MSKVPVSFSFLAMATFLASDCQWVHAEQQAGTILKTERFDRDPGWEGHNNRIATKKPVPVKQDFGYSATNHAGKSPGELGGAIQRSTKPASYAAALTPAKTLDDKLTASGTFAITACQPGAGVFFGFFNSQQPGGSGRPIGSLGMDFDFEGKGGRIAVRLISSGNKSCGTFLTPYLPGKFRPTPIRKDGTRYHWTLDYDPSGGSSGRFTFTIMSDTHKTQDYGKLPELHEKEAQARFPNTTTFNVDLPAELRRENVTFDRFGVCNAMKSGGTATLFFDDLQFNGQAQDFSKDPQWLATGNRVSYEDHETTGAHDFGYSATTNIAGGATGEMGGGLWRSGDFAFYAERTGPLNLDRPLEARGKVRLVTAGPDSDVFLGWFHSASKDKGAADKENFVGVHIGGPTRVGHYFIPVFANGSGESGKVKEGGPVLTPAKNFEWTIRYDPAANSGNGEIRVTLGEKAVTLALKPGQKAHGATFDRFGVFNSTIGGQMVKFYLDDLSYTVGVPR